MLTLEDVVRRRRHHEEAHTRTVEQQILDTLLRIEELLTAFTTRAQALCDQGGLGRPVVSGSPEVSASDMVLDNKPVKKPGRR